MMPGDNDDRGNGVPGGPILDELRGLGTPFMIVGVVATPLYMPQRLTQDLDILIVVALTPRVCTANSWRGERRPLGGWEQLGPARWPRARRA